MKFAIRTSAKFVAAALCTVFLSSCNNASERGSEYELANSHSVSKDSLRIVALREAAISNGLLRPEELVIRGDAGKQAVGGLLFASQSMSLNANISCQDCHLDNFASTDGLPNAVGVGGEGEGRERLDSQGQIVPRNALALWGVGGKNFETFFWDGKVQLIDGKVLSQYGDEAPSSDPLIVAVHLPSVEIREMLTDDRNVQENYEKENVLAAAAIQAKLAKNFANDPEIGPKLASAYGVPLDEVKFDFVADALAQFIRERFQIRSTRFHEFVFEDGPISENELNGGILFYGRGRCAMCHNGPYFTDFGFHAVAFPQAGFGKNGFGIDEGRYNVTLDPKDRFLFRTPSLFQTTLTGPYSHSGSLSTLEDAIAAHFDPLRFVDPNTMSLRERTDLFQRIGVSSLEVLPSMLTDEEVEDIKAFLGMLEFEDTEANQ